MQYTIALPANTNKTLALMMISGPHRNLPVIQQKILTPYVWVNKTRTSKVGAISKAQKLKLLEIVKGGTLWVFSKSNLLRGVTSERSDIVCWEALVFEPPPAP